jgi:hypothetical protein
MAILGKDKALSQRMGRKQYRLANRVINSLTKTCIVGALEIGPQAAIPCTCTSVVTHWSDGRTQERWSFSLPGLSLGKREMTANIGYIYREDAEYPDFLEVRNRLI